ncbi:MAG: hypothetical protein IT279_08305 [Ignavibacteriaceae bacterium]|nr:hypothetical protein [Ignavibacteriaceae bacterium]
MENSAKPSLTTSIVQLAINSTGRNPLHPETTAWKGRLAAEGLHITKTDLKRADRLITALYKNDLRDAFTRLSLFDGGSPAQSRVPLFYNQCGNSEPLDGSLNEIIGDHAAEEKDDIYTLLPLSAPFLLINTGKAFFLHCSKSSPAPALYTGKSLDKESPGRIRLSGISFGRKLNLQEEKDFRAVINRYFSSKGAGR